ncbi:Zinc finger protein [Trichinella spiralis]|uniref:Zinc finger protein n=1 Tax=Trichinella spiralis TaxID=6334 RepID=A0ABR3L3I8_TRISP
MKNQKKKKKQSDQCTKAEGKNELYHDEDATPTSVGSTRRHSFLLPQEASIDPASFQFNILSTGKVVCH